MVVFLLLVFGVVDLGRGVYAYNTITHCAREGVRYAVVHGSGSAAPVGPAANDATLANWVSRYAVGLQASSLTVTSSWPDGNVAGSNASVHVTVRYAFQPVTAFFRTLSLSNHSAGVILR
ncbi:MAG: pilus assembly protein [Verrucomicrobia bacterium]|nr:pilus assembly protein [Verrucomicrobiota bacterium]